MLRDSGVPAAAGWICFLLLQSLCSLAPGFVPIAFTGNSPHSLRGEPGISQRPHGSAMLTTGSFAKPNPKGCAAQFKSPLHPPRTEEYTKSLRNGVCFQHGQNEH